jgi:NAD-dependent DNA ligase
VTMSSLFKFASLYLPETETAVAGDSHSRELNPLRLDVDRLILHLRHEQKKSMNQSSSPLSSEETGMKLLEGRRVVFSGKLVHMTRDEACAMTERLGALPLISLSLSASLVA